MTGKPQPSDEQVLEAIAFIEATGLVPALENRMVQQTGRKRRLNSVLGPLVAFRLNAMTRHHRGRLAEVARTIDAMTPNQRGWLGLDNWTSRDGYDWLCRWFAWLTNVLETPQIPNNTNNMKESINND